MKRYATVYLRQGRLLIGPQHKTVTGVLLDEGQVEVVLPDDEIGIHDALLRALDNSRAEVPHPDMSKWALNDSPYHRAAGVQLWRDFVKGSKLVTVIHDKTFQFEPWENLGARRGFGPISTPLVETASTNGIFSALLRALELAR